MSSKTPTTVKELNVALADLSARLDVTNDQLKEDLKAIIEVEIQPIKQSIEHKHAALKKEMPKLIEKELKPLKEAMEFINKQFEEVKSEIGDLKSEIAIVRTENRAIKNDFSRLTAELKETRKELTELQQYSRRNNVERPGHIREPEAGRDFALRNHCGYASLTTYTLPVLPGTSLSDFVTLILPTTTSSTFRSLSDEIPAELRNKLAAAGLTMPSQYQGPASRHNTPPCTTVLTPEMV
ncbi:hypothetical protein HPB49_000023 [Dermacentor silvarum]|uniref:Uncharacterized protein n=1 Tax=Dermacentor silvarum TaxID=543639 RepID=A0ACB8CIM0_DERSI|nr:hypothetical protein HPB49_000023 [Dermacentor silvarum]